MHKIENVDLYQYNTMRLRSVAKVMYFPQSKEELRELISTFKIHGEKYHLLSGGSNIVFSEFVETPIISLMKVDDTISITKDNIVECGCSVRVQRLINSIKKEGLGGIEYLFSLPTSMGGAVFMNAGRGRKWGKSISDYIVDIQYLDVDSLEFNTISNANAGFSYRNSIFQHRPWIVTKIRFKFIEQSAEYTENLINERKEYSLKYLDAIKPSLGSVFCKANPVIMRVFMGFKIGGAKYSSKTPNWISNVNNATATDIKKLVRIVKLVHKIFFQKYKTEIRFLG